MTIPPVPADKIKEALSTYDRDQRNSPDWQGWENNKAHMYAIEHDGKRYPVKWVVSQATGFPRSEFSGGVDAGHANEYVQERGFKVVTLRKRNPPWSRDELILALDLYLQNRESPPGKKSEEVLALSELLNRLGPQIFAQRYDKFRNPGGVHMKLMNFRAIDPEQPGEGLPHVGKGDREVWDEFAYDPAHCHETANTIRNALNTLEASEETESDIEDEGIVEAEEGKAVTRVHVRRERNRKLIKRKKDSVLKKTGKLECEACGFRFDQIYGARGEGFIECHHTKPVSDLEEGQKTHLKDLALLCSNCHRMVHSRRPWLTLEELRSLGGIQKIQRLFK